MDCYKAEIAKIHEELKEKTLGELQAKLKTSRIDYTGAGFGYQLQGKPPKTMKKAEKFLRPTGFDQLIKKVESL